MHILFKFFFYPFFPSHHQLTPFGVSVHILGAFETNLLYYICVVSFSLSSCLNFSVACFALGCIILCIIIIIIFIHMLFRSLYLSVDCLISYYLLFFSDIILFILITFLLAFYYLPSPLAHQSQQSWAALFSLPQTTQGDVHLFIFFYCVRSSILLPRWETLCFSYSLT